MDDQLYALVNSITESKMYIDDTSALHEYGPIPQTVPLANLEFDFDRDVISNFSHKPDTSRYTPMCLSTTDLMLWRLSRANERGHFVYSIMLYTRSWGKMTLAKAHFMRLSARLPHTNISNRHHRSQQIPRKTQSISIFSASKLSVSEIA